jgi:hypothetical protein
LSYFGFGQTSTNSKPIYLAHDTGSDESEDESSVQWDSESDVQDEVFFSADEDEEDESDAESDGIAHDDPDTSSRQRHAASTNRSKKAILEGTLQYQRIQNLKNKLDAEYLQYRYFKMYKFENTFIHRAPNPALHRHYHASTSPDANYYRDIFVWAPHAILGARSIICPCCKIKDLTRKGWAHNPIARRVAKLDTHYHLLSYNYECTDCQRQFIGKYFPLNFADQ